MSDQYYGFRPQQPEPPSPRAASALAAVLLLLLFFVVGLAVGQSGVLSQTSTPTPPPVSVGPTPTPGATPAPGETPAPGATPRPTTARPSLSPGEPADFDLFWDALDKIREDFVGRNDLTDEQITYGAIRGMVEALGDTGHTVFLSREAVQSENESLNGTVVGIGVLLGDRDDRVVIISVIPGGPADRAGILPGDAILLVDGESVSGLAPEEVAPRVRGDAGTPVNLVIERPSDGARHEFDLVREEIHFPAATWGMVPGTNTAMLRLVQFSGGSAAELRTARDAAISAGATSFILDLRGNPGGLVHEAVDSASLFMTDKPVYLLEDADGNRQTTETNDEIPATDLPLVVLTDESSASSSEILAAALVSAGRAQTIGEPTFGTGTVLQDVSLPDGSAIRLATGRWLTPDGQSAFGIGLTPTEEVIQPIDEFPLDPTELARFTAGDIPTLPDTQLRRAIELAAQAPAASGEGRVPTPSSATGPAGRLLVDGPGSLLS